MVIGLLNQPFFRKQPAIVWIFRHKLLSAPFTVLIGGQSATKRTNETVWADSETHVYYFDILQWHNHKLTDLIVLLQSADVSESDSLNIKYGDWCEMCWKKMGIIWKVSIFIIAFKGEKHSYSPRESLSRLDAFIGNISFDVSQSPKLRMFFLAFLNILLIFFHTDSLKM